MFQPEFQLDPNVLCVCLACVWSGAAGDAYSAPDDLVRCPLCGVSVEIVERVEPAECD